MVCEPDKAAPFVLFVNRHKTAVTAIRSPSEIAGRAISQFKKRSIINLPPSGEILLTENPSNIHGAYTIMIQPQYKEMQIACPERSHLLRSYREVQIELHKRLTELSRAARAPQDGTFEQALHACEAQRQ